QRPLPGRYEALAGRTWQLLSSSDAGDPALAIDLAQALVQQPQAAQLHLHLGLVTTRTAQFEGPLTAAVVEHAAGCFQRAIAGEPHHVVAHLNLAECLAALGQKQQAVEQSRRTLTLLERLPELGTVVRDSGHFPPAFDHFRVEWERAAWKNAGNARAEDDAKRQLLRWRLHFLLAELTGDLLHFHEAVLARPNLPISRAMLGCALARQRRPIEALPHLRQAVHDNPFDLDAARALYHVLAEVGEPPSQRRLARDRWLLSQCAPPVVPVETWFAHAPPAGDELASILILCCNQLAYTQRCLESLFRCTRPPYELVIVDNGSTDETPAYLASIVQHPGPTRVAIIRNAENRGYPGGCNQALAQAWGEYLVFLNNDTIVTPGWLDGLVAWSLQDWPRVGLVGAVTNYSRPPQQVTANYTDLHDLDAFAARRRQEFAGQALNTERLTGFCLMVRREAIQKIGGYDEQFGLGFFDDDDLSVRALQAGFRMLVALDVFIHHYGSRTFTSLGIDTTRQLQDNFDLFQAKWGAEHSRGYRMPEAGVGKQEPGAGESAGETPQPLVVSAAPTPDSRPLTADSRFLTPARVSLCLIVKNEENNLRACLEGLSELFHEIVVVDTGSTDRTKELAVNLGARVFDFPWVDSFAAARNESLKHATGDWVFWLDGDDRLDADNRAKLRQLFAHLPPEGMLAFSMKCVCLPDPVSGTVTVVDHIRLFRNHPEIRWRYRVHEQILPAVRRLGGQVCFADVVIQHTGYQDPALRGRKLERDLRLLGLEHAEQPDDPFTLFNLGSVYQEIGKVNEAIPLLRRSLERSQPGDSIVRKLYALIAQCHRQLGQRPEALAACQEGRRLYADDGELLFVEAQLRRELNDRAGAEGCLLQLLNGREGLHFASVATGLRGYKARYQLAVVYFEQGRHAEAEAQWRAVLAEQPSFTPAWVGLGDLYLTQQRFDDAAQGWRQALTHHPQEAYLHARLGEVLLQQGRLDEATGCFREAVRLQPTYAAAHSSLLMCLQYDPGISNEALLAEHRRWAEQHAQVERLSPRIVTDRNPDRRLRVGYVSPDLRRHVVARFLESILAHHNPQQVEVVCYADVSAPDELTERLRGSVKHWRFVAGMPDPALAELIQRDGIDLLVDLAGHTGNRLGVFARKPATLQVSYLGYPGDTGLDAIDYRLTDAIVDPLAATSGAVAGLVRLSGGFCCYQPPAGVPEPGPLPALANGYVTFGSLHHLAKLNASVLDVWCELLRALPTAKLLVARHALNGSTVARLREQFRQRGIGADRLRLQQAPVDGRHWELYRHIDLALDPFPWSGHTTACESLWMGVPVVTLAGSRSASRMVASVLTTVGLPELIATAPHAYVDLAVPLANDRERLVALRATLRERLRTSALCDGGRFTAGLEAAYRQLWRRHVESLQAVHS
ncbi:MAG: glycosyltransferase, partial [Planctomycetia bacterium]|nr:glycosyltransferase [Planctomycetia bacterium]